MPLARDTWFGPAVVQLVGPMWLMVRCKLMFATSLGTLFGSKNAVWRAYRALGLLSKALSS